MTQEQENLDLSIISWEDESSQESATDTQAVINAINSDNDLENTNKTKEDEKNKDVVENTNIDWNDESTTNTETDNKDDKEIKTTKPGETPKEVESLSDKDVSINFLKSKGLLNYELEEGVKFEELSDDEKDEIIENGWEEALDLKLETTVKGLPNILKDAIKVATKGGDAMNFLYESLNSENERIPDNLDMTDVENQKYIIELKLANEGHDEEYIKDFVETLETSNKLKNLSEKEYKLQLKQQEARDIENQNKINNIAKERREKEVKYKNEIADTVKSNDSVVGVKLSKKDKETLPEYIAKANVDLGNGKTTSAFWADFLELRKDKETSILLGKLVKELKETGKLESIVKDATNNVTKNVRQNIQRQSGVTTTKQKTTGRMIADYL